MDDPRELTDNSEAFFRAASRLTILGAVVAYLFIAWIGNAAIAVSNTFDYPYNQRVDLTNLVSDMASTPLADVITSAATHSSLPLLNILMLTSFGLVVTGVAARSTRRFLLIAASVVVAPYGFLGLTLFVGPFDGEWLEEGWPLLQAFAMWSVVVWVITATHFGQSKTSPERSADLLVAESVSVH